MDGGIRAYLRLGRRWWWLLAVSAVVPMLLSYVFASGQPDLYQARAIIRVGASLQDPDPDPYQLNLVNTLASAYAELAKQGPVLQAVIARLGLNTPPDVLVSQIETRVHSGAHLLEIQVTDSNREAAALIANALADELIRRSPASTDSDPEQQEFIRAQLDELQTKVANVGDQIDALADSLPELHSAAELRNAQDQIAELEEVKALYQSTYAELLNVYQAESPNVLSLFDPAVVPQWPVGSKTKLIVVMAGAAGLGLALGTILLMEYLDTSIRWEGQGVQSLAELPVLGVMPRVSRRAVLSQSEPTAPLVEGARVAWVSILREHGERSPKTLLVASPGDVEDKSLFVASLAVALATEGNRVIAVDADMRNPSLHECFNQPNVTGLADVLGRGFSLDANSQVALRETDIENLYLLPAGRPEMDPTILLASPGLADVFAHLEVRGDIVLVDSPPVVGPLDASLLAAVAGGTMLVASVGLTSEEVLQQAKERLSKQQGVNLLGVVVNRVKLGSGGLLLISANNTHDTERERALEDPAYLTLAEAACRLGISKRRARQWCESGRLAATRERLRWCVDSEQLDRMLAELRQPRAGQGS